MVQEGDLKPNPVFVDVIKQEKFIIEEPPLQIAFQTSPEHADVDDCFADSYANDSSESEPEFFKFVPKVAVNKIKEKELKVLIPRLSSPCSYENPNEKSFVCDGCGKDFPNRTSFKLHYSKMHRKERIHQCKICHQTFR